MKQVLSATVVAAAVLATGQAVAATCDFDPLTGLAFSPDSTSISVLFNDFTAAVNDAATCGLPIDLTAGGQVIPAGTVIAYAASYHGTLDPTSTATYSISNGGVTTDGQVESTPADPGPNNVFFTNIVGTNGTTLYSDIDLAMLGHDSDFNMFSLETIDYVELARTTLDDIQVSVDELSGDHTALVTNLNVMGDLLNGTGQRFDQEDNLSMLAGVGSFTLGATGRRSLDGGFTALGGLAVFGQDSGGADAMGVLLSGSLRYAAPPGGFVRPYGEVGLITAPMMAVSFTRSYETNKGTTTTSGTGTAGFYGGFIKGGAVVDLDQAGELVLSASYAKDWLVTGAYSETLDTSNLFAASSGAQSGSFDVVKVGADWTVPVAPRTDVTLSGAIGRTMANTAWASDVTFGGSFTGAAVSENFAEYGARVAYELDQSQVIAGFLRGSTGEVSGTHIEVGGEFHVSF
jgi:hypothetical protein